MITQIVIALVIFSLIPVVLEGLVDFLQEDNYLGLLIIILALGGIIYFAITLQD